MAGRVGYALDLVLPFTGPAGPCAVPAASTAPGVLVFGWLVRVLAITLLAVFVAWPGWPDPAPPGPRLSNTGHGVGSVFVPNRELVVLGTASQTPTRTRNHNGYLLRWDAEGLLFDPGEGTQRQMLFAGVTASQITRICVTHFHGDHCLGLPGVLARISLDQVAHPVEIYYPAASEPVFSPPPAGRAVPRQRRRSRNGRCARRAHWPARQRSVWKPAHSTTACRPSGTGWPSRTAAGCCLTSCSRSASPARTSAGCSQGELVAAAAGSPSSEVSQPRPGQRFAFIMDTRLCDAAFELADQADMLVCESTFADAEAGLAREYGHLTASEAGRIAAEARARLLVLTHFSQRYDAAGSERLAGQAASAFGGEVVLARDLTRIPVPPRPPSAAHKSTKFPIDEPARMPYE